jgi:WD40 repeat protein
MNDVPRQTLKYIIEQYGPEVCADKRRCTGLLRDLCGEYRREIFVLISALEQNVVDGLRTLTSQLPFSVVLPRLAADLHHTTALSEEAARWAVAVWAEALGFVSETEIQNTLKTYSAPSPEPNAASNVAPTVAPTQYRLTYQWMAHDGEVSSIAFSPDGHHLISVGMDARARMWDVAGAHEEAALNQQTGILTAVAWHPEGQMLALGSGDTGIYIWHWKDAAASVPRFRGHRGGITGLTFLAGENLLASSSHDGTLGLWNAKLGTLTASLRGHMDAVPDLAASPDGAILVSAGGWDRTVRVWDVAKRQELWTLEGHSAQVTSVSFGSSSCVVASGSWDETVRLWNPTRGLALGTMRISPDPPIEPQDGSQEDGAAHMITSVAMAPDGELVAAGAWNGDILLWDLQRQIRVALLAGHAARVVRIAFSPGGRWFASADDAGMICLWRKDQQAP